MVIHVYSQSLVLFVNSLMICLSVISLALCSVSHLGLEVCYNISDRGVSHLVQCAKLADLTISYCDKVHVYLSIVHNMMSNM